MRKAIVTFVALMLMAGAAGAYEQYLFHCDGFGNLVKASPPIFTGPVSDGAFAPGVWTMTVNDTGWPPITNPAARWAYIWTTYYAPNYDGVTWTGTFDCALFINHTGIGTLTGVCDLTFQFMDGDGDGVLDEEECMDGLSGAVIILHEGTGLYAELCGNGSYSGYYYQTCNMPPSDPNYILDEVHFDADIWLQECGLGNEQSTWGAVKALFR
ncbi:MAG: hypothetical protein V1694_03460 [Candidatus Eisenbacteria bacterium]